MGGEDKVTLDESFLGYECPTTQALSISGFTLWCIGRKAAIVRRRSVYFIFMGSSSINIEIRVKLACYFRPTLR